MIVSNEGGSHTYTARVSESCLALHGCAWLPPDDPGVIAQLVLDAEAGPDLGGIACGYVLRGGQRHATSWSKSLSSTTG
jgi:hypothetical protein